MTTLLLHGALGSKSQLEPIKAALSTSGRDVYTMNFSGHSGESFAADFGIERFAADVLEFLRQYHLKKVDIFGYSMGGYVAVWFAHRYPALVNAIVTLGTKFDWSVASAEVEVRKMNPVKIQEKIPAFARILESRHAPNDWKELLNKTAAMMTNLGNKPLLTNEIFESIATPITIVLGDQDDMADRSYSEQVASMLPNGKFVLLENTGHPIEKVKWIPFL